MSVKAIQPAALLWTEDGPRSALFDDVYFSRAGGLAETRHVFLAQNGLADRLRDAERFTIGETGFGTGLNFLATLALWREQRRPDAWLHYVATEKHPLSPDDLQRALALWPALAELAGLLLAQYPPLVPGFHRLVLAGERVTLTLLLGDSATLLTGLEARVDAWYLDGFAPARNAGMWSPALFREIARLSHAGSSFATFTAAGEVRRQLQAAGFTVEKVPGFAAKREMLRGRFSGTPATVTTPWLPRAVPGGERRVAVIGAGIAGAATARALALRGVEVDVFEAAGDIAGEGSGNPGAMVYPHLANPALAAESFSQQAFLFAQARFGELPAGIWNPCGLLWLLRGNQAREGRHLEAHPWPASLVRRLDANAATAVAGTACDSAALYFPTAGWLRAREACAALLGHDPIRVHRRSRVDAITHEGQWRLDLADGRWHETPLLVLANAGAARLLAPAATLPLLPVRGQIALAPSTAASRALRSVICHGGYICPDTGQGHCLGATFQAGRSDTGMEPADQEAIHAALGAALPELAAGLGPVSTWQGRAALRWQTPDYLPLVGALPDFAAFIEDFAGLREGRLRGQPEARLLPGLFCTLGHGSQGFTQALLAAEMLAADINGEPSPVPRRVREALHPARFWVRQLKRREI